MRTPNFFIVGAPKCGTTAMHAYLSRHPDVFMSPHKEPHYFGVDLQWFDRERMPRSQYETLFQDARTEAVVGESSVFYLLSKNAASEIRAYAPDARILIMLRNPADMIYSFHSQRLYNGTEEIRDFGEAIAAEDDRKHGLRLPRNIGLRQGLYYTDIARYADQVARYFAAFPPSRVLVLLYDDFRRDTAAVYRTTLEFLGVDPNVEVTLKIVNPNTVNRSSSLQRLMGSPPDWLRTAAHAVLPSPRLRARFGGLVRQLNTRVEPRQPMLPALRQQLQQEFLNDISRLEKLIGRNLDSWKRE